MPERCLVANCRKGGLPKDNKQGDNAPLGLTGFDDCLTSFAEDLVNVSKYSQIKVMTNFHDCLTSFAGDPVVVSKYTVR
jgi:hypothetical protein